MYNMFKRFLLALIFFTTSHLLAWQPTGWVYKMGDYMYASESEAWHWKMADWSLWSRPLSVQTWGASSADGWSYYTWPFFWSHSLKEWCYTASDYGDAYVVNLRSGEWTIFGKSAEEETTVEKATEDDTTVEDTTAEEAAEEYTTIEETVEEVTTVEETQGFAPSAFAPGTMIEVYDTLDDENSVVFISDYMAFFEYSAGQWNALDGVPPVVYVSKDKAYFEYVDDLSWADIGNYIYEKTGNDTAKSSVSYFYLDYLYGVGLENEVKYDFVFSSKSNFTSIEYDEEKIIEDPCIISEPQDVAPSSLNNLSAAITTYGGGSSKISYYSDGTGTYEGDIGTINFDYTYKKTGPREGLVTFDFTLDGEDLVAEFICHFINTSNGFFVGLIKDRDSIEDYGLGKFSIE